MSPPNVLQNPSDAIMTLLVPGDYVRHPQEPGWGTGQVQSVTGPRVTVNFEHAGKVLINIALIELEVVKPDRNNS